MFLGWISRLRYSFSPQTELFSNSQCYVRGSLKPQGFGDLELPDRYRWLRRQVVCYCDVGHKAISAPYVLIRALPSTAGGVRLDVRLGKWKLGEKAIPGYGTYYYEIPPQALDHYRNRTVSLRLTTLNSGKSKADGRVALYEIRILDADSDDFPDKHALHDKLVLFSPEGGKFHEVVSTYPFSSEQRLLEIGAGEGHLSFLMAAYSGASVTGIDVVDYDHGGARPPKERLAQAFRLVRSQLVGRPGLGSLAEPDGLASVVSRTQLVTMSAEEMRFDDSTFDFVYSLNVMEHIPHPDRALAEICRVLRPGGLALLQFSPLYFSDSGSHLPPTLGYMKPRSHLLMTREAIKQAIRDAGGVPNEVDNILDSLNGCAPGAFIDAVRDSGLTTVYHEAQRGFTIPGARESLEFQQVLTRYSEEDLTTYGMVWVLEKPVETHMLRAPAMV